MNRTEKRQFDKDVRSKMTEAQGIQRELRKGKYNKAKFERLKKLYSEMEQMGVIRKKTKFEKFKEKFFSFFINWRQILD